MPCPSTSIRALSGSAIRLQTSRLGLRWLGYLACCLVTLVTTSARSLPRFPSAETVAMPLTFPEIGPNVEPVPAGLRLADLDGDGDLDVVAAVILFGRDYLATWLNKGDGTFTLRATVAYDQNYIDFIETADVDLDGDIDVVLSVGEHAGVYLNDGSGKLAKFGPGYYPSDFGGANVTIVDVDRDHFPDLLSVSLVDFTSPGQLRIFLSHHDGSFGLPPVNGTVAAPNIVMTLPEFTRASQPVAQDFNADGLVDLVFDDAHSERLLYYKANGVASWESRPTILAAGYYPTQAQASDIDLDGDLDLVAVDDVLGALVVLKNNGGEFSAPVLAVSLSDPGTLGLADLNNDCFPDAFSENAGASYVSVMLNRGDGSFAEPINYSMGSLLYEVQAGDVDGDGDLDLVASSVVSAGAEERRPGFLSVTRNLGTGEFWAPKAYDIFTQTDGIASGDFDGDHRADFAVGGGVLFGGYEGFSSLDGKTSPYCSNCRAEVADLNSDGLADVVQSRNDSTVRAFISNGDGSFTQSSSLTTSEPTENLSLGHLNKDKFWDFVNQEGSAYNVEFFGATSTTFSQGPSVTWSFGGLIGVLLPKLADLNGDGADDLLVPNVGSSELGVGINNGDGTSFSKTNYPIGAVPAGLDVADYTGDGKLDAVVSVDSGSVIVYPGKGDGSLSASQTYPVGPSPGRIASADFDGDGDIDLIVSTTDHIAYSVTYVENAGKGVFSKTVALLDARTPSKVVTTDLDGDGDPDFAVVNPGAQTLTTFENRQLTEDPAKSHPQVCDLCPKDKAKAVPGVCGCGVADADTDDDGVLDCKDACPKDGSKRQAGICGCGVSDRDTDGDGKADCLDGCPQDPHKSVAGVCGCGKVDVDTDHDGTADCQDGCPSDVGKIAPGSCGCGVADSDSDGDAIPDCLDACPDDAAKTSPGLCGCGARDGDGDSDGTPDCSDGCPRDAHKIRVGACGCGTADTDTDGDGWPDCVDECPSTPGICTSSGGESAVGSGGADGDDPSNGGAAGTAGARPNESETAGAGLGGESEPNMGGGGDDTPPNEAGSASDSGGAPEQMFTRPTGTQISSAQHASGCDCSTASNSGAWPLGLLPLSLLLLRQRRRAARRSIARREKRPKPSRPRCP
jgi:MYXO-CTERM domain-containing protein